MVGTHVIYGWNEWKIFRCRGVKMATVDTKNMEVVYERPKTLINKITSYCPGCTHGIAHRLVAEVIDEMG